MSGPSAAWRPLPRAGAAFLLGCSIWAQAGAQPLERANAVLLVAKQIIADPNFRQTVVVVTRAPEARTIGVILNRPTPAAAARYFAPDVPAANYRDRVFFGGPVLREVIVALFKTDAAPPNAFRILPGVYLTMQPETIASLLADRNAQYRLYAGFSAWAPRQLESELERDSWLVVPASEDLMFRKNTDSLWRELTERASAERASAPERIRASPARNSADAAPFFFTRVPDAHPGFRASRVRSTRFALARS